MLRVQRQLDSKYQDDVFLRDQLIAAAGKLKYIRSALKQVVPTSASEAKDLIGSFLSSEPRSTVHKRDSETNFDSLGQRYGGEAEPTFPKKRNKYKQGNYRHNRPYKYSGCWLCKKNHKEADHHTKEEIIQSLRKMKNAYISADELLQTFSSIDDSDETSSPESDDDEQEASYFASCNSVYSEINK